MKLILLAILSFGSIENTLAQTNDILGKFTASTSDNTITLSWQIIAGSTCFGTQIYRSTDSVNFTQIGEIFGICGSVSKAENYEFRDADPVKNRINYYRLKLGSSGFSRVASIDIIDVENGKYHIRPHPIVATALLYFQNISITEYRLSLYNQCGVCVETALTKGNYFDFNSATLPSGVYYFIISDSASSSKAKGRLMIQH